MTNVNILASTTTGDLEGRRSGCSRHLKTTQSDDNPTTVVLVALLAYLVWENCHCHFHLHRCHHQCHICCRSHLTGHFEKHHENLHKSIWSKEEGNPKNEKLQKNGFPPGSAHQCPVFLPLASWPVCSPSQPGSANILQLIHFIPTFCSYQTCSRPSILLSSML